MKKVDNLIIGAAATDAEQNGWELYSEGAGGATEQLATWL